MKAIILVDFQKDFTEVFNGSLAVPDTDQEYVNEVIKALNSAKRDSLPIFATRDYHPDNHSSFKEYGGLWPKHCVINTSGGEFCCDKDFFDEIIDKGINPKIDNYSGFRNGEKSSNLYELLVNKYQVDSLVIFGLATDFCVKDTAIQAAKLGFKVEVVTNLCKGINTSNEIWDEFRKENIKLSIYQG